VLTSAYGATDTGLLGQGATLRKCHRVNGGPPPSGLTQSRGTQPAALTRLGRNTDCTRRGTAPRSAPPGAYACCVQAHNTTGQLGTRRARQGASQ
jgi:hypothetical protein